MQGEDPDSWKIAILMFRQGYQHGIAIKMIMTCTSIPWKQCQNERIANAHFQIAQIRVLAKTFTTKRFLRLICSWQWTWNSMCNYKLNYTLNLTEIPSESFHPSHFRASKSELESYSKILRTHRFALSSNSHTDFQHCQCTSRSIFSSCTKCKKRHKNFPATYVYRIKIKTT
jgi:hypothetical protein